MVTFPPWRRYIAGSPISPAASSCATITRSGSRRERWPAGQPTSSPVDTSVERNEPIATRFIIDILSGTSAGGINAIFLAKGLANDKQISGLKDLWVEEGSLGKLINDKHSLDEQIKPMGLVEPPKSLLNSRRMYFKLLEAFQKVDRSEGCSTPQTQGQEVGSEASPSPYVDELDLYVTTTDIRGVALPIRLADRVVYEKRYRNVFHFSYSNNTFRPYANDCTPKHNSFLAFAARCTSSFPFAFEPMCLSDIDDVQERDSGVRAGLELR